MPPKNKGNRSACKQISHLGHKVRIYGPYIHRDKSCHVILIFEDGHRRSLSLPKFLMENLLNRPLKKKEWVKHKDGNVKNNELANLILMEE